MPATHNLRPFAAALILSWFALLSGCAQPNLAPPPPTATPQPTRTIGPIETPTLTPTLVPTFPPLPTRTPTVKPEVKLEVLSYTAFRAGSQLVYVAGAAINRGTAPAGEVRTAVSLLDTQGKVASTGTLNETSIWYVPPGGTYPFLITVPTAPQTWKDVRIQFEAKLWSADQLHKPYWDLKIDSVSGVPPQGAYPNYGYTGRVTNSGPKRARMVQVVAIAFDAAGKVIDVGSGYVPFEYLNAGQDAPFQFMLHNTKSAPAKYQMLAEGYLTE